MEPERENGLSYSSLFNLEPLMNVQLAQQDDDFDNYRYSSQDESRGSQGQVMDHANGYIKRSSDHGSMRRRRPRIEAEAGLSFSPWRDTESNDGEGEGYVSRISEERYRAMLGEHVQKYRRKKFREGSSSGLGPSRTGMTATKHSHGSKNQKWGSESLTPLNEGRVIHGSPASPEYCPGVKYDSNFSSGYVGNGFVPSLDSAYLDLGEGITYPLLPTYDKLASSLDLTNPSDVRIDEYYLNGSLDFRSLASMLAIDRRSGSRMQARMGEPQSQYESLQARLKALSACNSVQKFSLQVCDLSLDSCSLPEGAAGGIRRLIMSESGVLQVYYVKVLEKGDTYEIIERRLPKKEVVKKDPSVIEKEEMEKIAKVWINIARRDILKHQKAFISSHKKQLAEAKKWSEMCQREVKMKVQRSLKWIRAAPIRTRKLARDMLLFHKRVEKEQAEIRKKEEREAAEALKREEELREAKRQKQRLNFLLSQTELYSHFMQNKPTTQGTDGEPEGPEVPSTSVDIEPEEEDDPEYVELKKEALRAAQQAVSQQKQITSAFDDECLKLRQAGVSEDSANDTSTIGGSSNIDLLHPSTMPATSSVQSPELFKGCLKEYQLKGLQWLVNCYEQGLNGILADEMGLGKTIQAMAFLAHLAEEKNIWGPFLVVAPASVLNNWADEISRFCPDLKTLPYWGGITERTILRKNINAKRLYKRDAAFHILVTNYQLLVTDEKYLKRVKWQYMVLDEAQAIKSSNSLRWKTLLSFNCRNRLLLTGTPIQNNMAELWALLHFIMPTLFDSHEQFNEWFSKGIESHAEHGGTLNEHQLNRLHAVLKPFMLRRVKKDVITEMTAKTEVTVHCKLSSRQQAFYQAIKNKISLAELLEGSRGLNEKKLVNLMNIVMQLRKVCSHPELFERNEGTTYFYFGAIPRSLQPPPFGELEDIYYAGVRNPITYEIPKLIHQEICRDGVPCSAYAHTVQPKSVRKLFDIYLADNVHQSSVPRPDDILMKSGTFGFTRLMDLSAEEVTFLAKCSVLERMIYSIKMWDRPFLDEILEMFMESEGDLQYCHQLDEGKVRAVTRMLLMPKRSESNLLRRKLVMCLGDSPYEALVVSHHDRFISSIRLLHSIYAFIPKARAPPIETYCSDRSFADQKLEELQNPWVKKLFLGFARTSEYNGPKMPSGPPHHLIQEVDAELPFVQPVLQLTYKIFGSSPPVQSFDSAKMLTDSGKLHTLDILLKRLRAGNHRVLLFAQMTRMLDILEDYMNYRKYKYLRLDGSSSIMDRRDMVWDFQNRSDIFVFLLSTRAGGLGINLTAADTVIFYEIDWNPTLDLQAMDRAHRLGQTKEVTVYRLICKETIEEKILQRASQKNAVQQLVMTGGHVQGDILAREDVISLLLDDAQLEQTLREAPPQDRQKKKRGAKGIRVDEDGEAHLEELTELGTQVAGLESEKVLEPENAKTTNKKRKSTSDKQALPRPRHPSKSSKNSDSFVEPNTLNHMEDFDIDSHRQHQKKLKMKKSVNKNLEPAFIATNPPATAPSPSGYSPFHDFGAGDYSTRGEGTSISSRSST
ncbi:DNA helicase INO80 [Acorus calamus]|uniref:Chromatin-remodeling ATPase INO80 n=1 Tax=Acorus calamus TaxID=4465 RepID=A0AAV9EXD5_ACOCL|nr:DNA helicase INO80 [Acorus calamus]